MSSKEYQNELMAKFTPDELAEGNPRVAGLRRLVEEEVGQVIQGITVVNQSPSPGNNMTAVVTYTLGIKHKETGDILTFSSAADASQKNTDPLFRQYPTAMAETRAESRALRKALKLYRVSADELSEVAKLDKELADPIQLVAIESILSRKRINKEQFAKDNKIALRDGEFVISSDEAKFLLKKLQDK